MFSSFFLLSELRRTKGCYFGEEACSSSREASSGLQIDHHHTGAACQGKGPGCSAGRRSDFCLWHACAVDTHANRGRANSEICARKVLGCCFVCGCLCRRCGRGCRRWTSRFIWFPGWLRRKRPRTQESTSPRSQRRLLPTLTNRWGISSNLVPTFWSEQWAASKTQRELMSSAYFNSIS